MAEPLPTITAHLLSVCPPWLLRLVGERFMRALGAPMDAIAERAADSVKQRFPNLLNDSSLAHVGRERRIRRGPAEEAATYARRLRPWWDAHRKRGGPYALLEQLYAYTQDWLSVRMDVVYQSGTRRWIDTAGTITRDSIEWGGHGQPPIEGTPLAMNLNAPSGSTSITLLSVPSESEAPRQGPYVMRIWDGGNPTGEVITVSHRAGNILFLSAPIAGGYGAGTGRVARRHDRWAHAWLFFHLPDTIPLGFDYLVTSDGDRIVTSDGDYIVATRTITPGEITADESAIFTALPREWSAAHIPYITVVLLWSTRRLWDYPQPVPTWAEWEASGALFGDEPVLLRAE